MKELLMKWWLWVCMVFMVAIVAFVSAVLVYNLNPVEIHLYANEEMVATAQGMTKSMSEENFNECMDHCGDCKEYLCNEFDVMCIDACFVYYNGETLKEYSSRYKNNIQ